METMEVMEAMETKEVMEREVDSSDFEEESACPAPRLVASPPPAPPPTASPSPSPPPAPTMSQIAAVNQAVALPKKDMGGGGSAQMGNTISVVIQEWDSKAEYMNEIAAANDPYAEYLKQRESKKDSPAFYLDVSNFFFAQGKNKSNEEMTYKALIILTNIVELRLDNPQLLRIVGYKLSEQNQLELGEFVFREVIKMKPEEPQSYRDLALVLEKQKRYQEAIDLLEKVLIGQYDYRLNEIELTAILDLQHIFFVAQKEGIDVKFSDERFNQFLTPNFGLDLRVIAAWDTDMTDIDLHVYEEHFKEHCYFGNKRTSIGGHLSRDFTQGYGPEEYWLRDFPPPGFPKGKKLNNQFTIKCKYYGSHQQSLTGGTTILCTIFTNFLRENEKTELVTLRLQENKDEVEVCKAYVG